LQHAASILCLGYFGKKAAARSAFVVKEKP